MKKKIAVLLAILFLVGGFTACDKGKDKDATEIKKDGATEAEKENGKAEKKDENEKTDAKSEATESADKDEDAEDQVKQDEIRMKVIEAVEKEDKDASIVSIDIADDKDDDEIEAIVKAKDGVYYKYEFDKNTFKLIKKEKEDDEYQKLMKDIDFEEAKKAAIKKVDSLHENYRLFFIKTVEEHDKIYLLVKGKDKNGVFLYLMDPKSGDVVENRIKK